jgi:cytochrome c biogenesis protein CcmG, thiol:disulfide interchange protein DsbE
MIRELEWSNTMKRSLAFVFGCSMPFLILGCVGSEPAPAEIGDIAPAFSLPAVGQSSVQITSDQIQGKITVLNFWSTTCAVCLKETEDLAHIHKSGKAVVIGIALEKDADYLGRFVKDRGISYPVAVGNEDVFSRYDGYAIPYTLVLDRSRAIRLRVYGRVEADELTKVIDKIDRTSVALAPARQTRPIQ